MTWYLIVGVVRALTIAALVVHLFLTWSTKRGWFMHKEPAEQNGFSVSRAPIRKTENGKRKTAYANALHTVLVIRAATTYGSALAFGRRSSI